MGLVPARCGLAHRCHPPVTSRTHASRSMVDVMTICPRCRAPHDSRRTTTVAADPLLLTGGARLCASCAPTVVDVVIVEDLATQHDLAA